MIITGKGKSGSWQIRGVQLGASMGMRVIPNVTEQVKEPAILVKRPTDEILHALRDVPIIWDVVDSWPQPHGNMWEKSECLAWAREMVRKIRPAAIVAATQAMANDFVAFAGVPVKWIPHHGRPGIEINPIRRDVRVVGYEGGDNYVSRWGAVLHKECESRGWRFVHASGPHALASFDIVVALRDQEQHGGYAPRHWKSAVKLANAHASGTPFIGNRERGYMETSSGFEYWADNKQQLSTALDWMERYETRSEIHNQFLKSAITLESVAKEYSAWIAQLRL